MDNGKLRRTLVAAIGFFSRRRCWAGWLPLLVEPDFPALPDGFWRLLDRVRARAAARQLVRPVAPGTIASLSTRPNRLQPDRAGSPREEIGPPVGSSEGRDSRGPQIHTAGPVQRIPRFVQPPHAGSPNPRGASRHFGPSGGVLGRHPNPIRLRLPTFVLAILRCDHYHQERRRNIFNRIRLQCEPPGIPDF